MATKLVVVGGPEDAWRTVAELVAEANPRHLAVSGGSTPMGLYRGWNDGTLTSPDWESMDVWLVDERVVPRDHPRSNAGMIAPLLPVPPSRFHGPMGGATAYERDLCQEVGEPPQLDLVLLGLGADGHTASLFPEGSALEAPGWVAEEPDAAPEPRITLTLATLEQARRLVFLVTGRGKHQALQGLLGGDLFPTLSQDCVVVCDRSAHG